MSKKVPQGFYRRLVREVVGRTVEQRDSSQRRQGRATESDATRSLHDTIWGAANAFSPAESAVSQIERYIDALPSGDERTRPFMIERAQQEFQSFADAMDKACKLAQDFLDQAPGLRSHVDDLSQQLK